MLHAHVLLHILQSKICSTGQECLELGCGAGVVGVALFRVGTAVLHLTDGNAAAVENCRHNLAINQCTHSPDNSMAVSQASASYPASA